MSPYNIPRLLSLSSTTPRPSPMPRMMQRHWVRIIYDVLVVILILLLLLKLPLSMTRFSKPIPMELSHSMEYFILSRRLYLRRSSLDPPLSCFVVSARKMILTDWPYLMRLIRPRPGGRRHVIDKLGRPL